MIKLLISFILIAVSHNSCALGLSVKEDSLTKKIYRNNFKEFYQKVTLNIESHSKNGVLSYDGYQIQNDYMEMIDSIKKDLKKKKIAVFVNSQSEEYWSGYNSFFYDDSAKTCKDIMKRRIDKDFLTARQNTLNIIYPNLLKKGWSISRSGFTKGKLTEPYYKLPILISVKLNMSVRSAMWSLSYKESINSRVYNLKSDYLAPLSDNLKLAEVKARDWDFRSANQYYLKALKENNQIHTLDTKIIKLVINKEQLAKKDYDKNSEIFEKSNNAEIIGKSIAILGGALIMEKSGLPREELTSLQALYAIDVLTDNKNMSNFNNGLSEISNTNKMINEYKIQQRERDNARLEAKRIAREKEQYEKEKKIKEQQVAALRVKEQRQHLLEQEKAKSEQERQREADKLAREEIKEQEKQQREHQKKVDALAKNKAEQAYLSKLLAGARLGVKNCYGTIAVGGQLPKIKPEVVSCVDVHFDVVCPKTMRSTTGIIKNHIGMGTGCFGDYGEIESDLGCKVEDLRATAQKVTSCN